MPAQWRAQVISLFPEMFPGPLGCSLAGQALRQGLWSLDPIDLRTHGIGPHRKVDDTPYGGGSGMVMRADVIASALNEASNKNPDLPIYYMSPRGKPLQQTDVQTLALQPGCTILCGRFEGVDQRVLDYFSVQEVSIGDYILSGGELAAMAMIDACVRLLPGVLANPEATVEESFGAHGHGCLLEYPHYTQPAEFEGMAVPDVLRSGNHAHIRAWRLAQAEAATQKRRPDLWQRYTAAKK